MKRALFLVVLVAAIKLLFLDRTPFFGDEGLYCYLGYQMQQGWGVFWRETIFVWKDAPLLPILNGWALLIPGLSPIFACRGTVVVMAAIGALFLWGITRNWWVLIFYILLQMVKSIDLGKIDRYLKMVVNVEEI